MVLVAPFTQLTFLSFDLQIFLFEVFHLTFWAKVGHLTGMIGVNFFLLAGLSTLRPEGAPWWVNASSLYALVLLAWYAAVAVSARLKGWWVASAVLVLALWGGAAFYDRVLTLVPWANPWGGVLASAVWIAFSHAPEPKLPPRAIEGATWKTVREALQARTGLGMLSRALRITLFVLWGTLDELWAAPRLMPYNLLRILFVCGYEPARWREIQDWSRRALASENPALDYVGIGGATSMQLPSAERLVLDAAREVVQQHVATRQTCVDSP